MADSKRALPENAGPPEPAPADAQRTQATSPNDQTQPFRQADPGATQALPPPSPHTPTSGAAAATPSVLGPYELLEKLGEGGMGAVYKARHTRLNKLVAVKVLPVHLTRDPAAVARFDREMKAVGALEHPNIVRAMDAGEHQGTHFLVMEYVEGQDLQKLVKQRGPLSITNACKIIRQAAIALAHAHQHGLVHRDIKPSNLFISKQGQLKLLDLGLARLGQEEAHEALTSTGVSLGTPDYMAPEQWADTHSADARCDLYALGCTLFFLLTGRAPFGDEKHKTVVSKLTAHVQEPPPALTTARPETPPELEQLYQKLLAKTLEERLGSAKELAKLLEPFCKSAGALPDSIGRVASGVVDPAPPAPSDTRSPLPAAERGVSAAPAKPQAEVQSPARRRWLLPAAIGAVALALLACLVPGLLNRNPPGTRSQPPAPSAIGWQGWPADAPKPAIAPFDAAQAKAHQEAWAAYLKVPVEYTNSIGMKFRLIPPGEFLMGSTAEEIKEALQEIKQNEWQKLWQSCIKSEAPQHKVLLTEPIFLGVHEVTQSQYENVMGTNPAHFSASHAGKDLVAGQDTTTFPVEMVNWPDVIDFCVKLNQREQFQSHYARDGDTVDHIDGAGYRLPTEAEWEFSCRAGTTTKFWMGESDQDLLQASWLATNAQGQTHAVGEQKANPFGLCETHGNVWEWVQDAWSETYYEQFRETSAVNPQGPSPKDYLPVIRGGGWSDDASFLVRSTTRSFLANPSWRFRHLGLRAALTVAAVKQAIAKEPPRAIAPFDAAQARAHQEAWAAYLKVPVEYTNSIGMKFRLIPPGEFTMGSTEEEIEAALKRLEPYERDRWTEYIQGEAPQHKVILPQAIYLGMHEVRQADYQQVMGKNPSYFTSTGPDKLLVEKVVGMDTTQHPVEGVNWSDATEFCTKLSQQDEFKPFYLGTGETITQLGGTGYRLPTEAEWEFACRAGTTARFWSGERDADLARAGWSMESSHGRTHPAGESTANPFGLFDVHGNVWEWVQDWWDPTYYRRLSDNPAITPSGPSTAGTQRVIRGGFWNSYAPRCRASSRGSGEPQWGGHDIGFRVVLSLDAVRQALKVTGPAQPKLVTNTPAFTTGWRGWPADAPKPAIAPFDVAQAKAHQETWAAYLKVPVEYTNTLGMKFQLIPPGEFVMGSTPAEIEQALQEAGDNKHWQECVQSQAPQHKVILTQPLYLGANEVTQAEYQRVMGKNPSHFAPTGIGKESVAKLETTAHPVEMVSWNDAAEFCAKLSGEEKLKPFYFLSGDAVTPLAGTGYRLPSEAQWEFACRAGTTTKYWSGDRDEDLGRVGWFGGNAGGRTHATSELIANPFGLADVHGNAGEWVEDGWDTNFYGQFLNQPAVNPNNPFSASSRRVVRGGGWYLSAPFHFRSSNRIAYVPKDCDDYSVGFRVSLPVEAVKEALANREPSGAAAKSVWHGWPADAPNPAIAPFDAAQAKAHQEAWAEYLKVPVEYTNGVGMKFRLIPPGEFLMGSTAAEIETARKEAGDDGNWQQYIRSEGPQQKVILTRPLYFGVTEVTQGEYESVMGKNPAHFAPTGTGKEAVTGMKTTRHPVEQVSWKDAIDFCVKLNRREQVRPFSAPDGATNTPQEAGYRLPSEAEWEFACRAGTVTRYWVGDKENDLRGTGWFGGNSQGRTHAAGELKANPYGLLDIHGNVWEWVQDGWEPTFYSDFVNQPAINPLRPNSSVFQRVLRGGYATGTASNCRSSVRGANDPTVRYASVGFRVSLPVDAVKQALKTAGPTMPPAAEETLESYFARNRRAAERALAVGGYTTVEIKEPPEWRTMQPGQPLPQGPFVVRIWSIKASPTATSGDLDVLAGLRHVEQLNLMAQATLDEEVVPKLAALKSPVKELGLGHLDLKTSALERLPVMPHVHVLWLSAEQIDDEWRFLSRFPALRSLEIYGATVPALGPLGDAPQVRYVRLAGATELPDAAQISDIQKRQPRLRIFHLAEDELQVLGTDPARVAARRFIEAGIPIQVFDAAGKRRRLSLEEIEQTATMRYVVPAIPRGVELTEDLRGLLTHLDLQNFKAEGLQGADSLARLLKARPDIDHLALTDSDLTDEGLRLLQSLQGLHGLYLKGTQVTPAGVAAFHRAVPACGIQSDSGEIAPEYGVTPLR